MEPGQSTLIWEKMAHLSLDMLCTFDQEGNFVHVSDASYHILGYDSSELSGRHYSIFLHPDDFDITQEATKDILNGSRPTSFENRFIHKNGTVVPISWSAIWSKKDQAIFAVARDITELKLQQSRLEESEQRYKGLFENNPDVIFLENTDGLITEVNQSFCNVLGRTKEETINQPASSFLPPSMISVSERSLKEALLGGTLRYDLELETRNQERRIFDTVKYPILVNGKIVGAQTIAKDITPMIRSFETIQQQAHKLNTIFESITDAFITIDHSGIITYINKEAEKLVHLDRQLHIGKNLWDIFPNQVRGVFYDHYVQAFETGKSVHFTAFLQEFNIWLQVKAFPSAEGLSIYFDDVTEQVHAKEELEKLSLVASNTTNGVIITNKDRTIEWVNEAFTILTGYSFNEAVGKSPAELLFSEDTNSEIYNAAQDKITDGQTVSFEILNLNKKGEEIWLSVLINPIFNKLGEVERYVSIQTDITDRLKTQQELEKLSLVASKTNNSVLIADKNWQIEWVNDGFTRLMGYTLAEAIGMKPSDLLHKNRTNRSSYEALEPKLLSGEPVSLEVLNIKKSGEEVWVNVEISPVFNERGELYRFIEIQTDITELKNSELDLAKLAKDLYRQNTDLQQFTYIVSHNLRSPVANALGLANLLTSIDKHSERFESSLIYLKQSIAKLDEVLRDINTILGIRDSKGNLEREIVDVSTVLQQALYSFKETLEKIGAKIHINIPEASSLLVNKAYLYSIFYNLLSNAIKYKSDERPLEIKIRCFNRADQGSIIYFSDNGSGFDMKKAQNNLFKLYKRFHHNKEGRGMGLYLIKTHLEAMGGSIEVTSFVDVGTKFLIHLPD